MSRQRVCVLIQGMTPTSNSFPIVRPPVTPGSHPIETTRYTIPTPPIATVQKEVKTWIENRVPGAIIYSKPRTGKTRMIMFLSRQLPVAFGTTLPIAYILCKEYKVASEGVFFGDLLESLGHALWSSGKASAKRHRLIQYLRQKVEQTNQDRLILFLDEAQKLHEPQYDWLIDIYNELDRCNIAVTMLLVGQEDELLAQRNAFHATRKTQILGRFMIHECRLRGLTSQQDIESCLAAYEGIEFPSESGWSLASYFFPSAYQHAFKLSGSAADLWQAFKATKEAYCLPGPLEVGMQYFCRSVEQVMKNNATLDDVQPTLSLRMWKEAVENSGFVAADRYSQEFHGDKSSSK